MKNSVALALGLAGLLAACTAGPAPTPVAPDAATGASPTPAPSATAQAVPRGRFIFYDDFEQGLDAWAIAGEGGGIAWLRLNAFSCGGAWTMLLGKGDMERFAGVKGESILSLKAPLDLKDAKKPSLAYDVRGLTIPETAVRIQAEASRDGTTWTPVGDEVEGRYRYANTHVAALTAFVGGPLSLRFRATFDVGSDAIAGMLLDDVKVIEAGG